MSFQVQATAFPPPPLPWQEAGTVLMVSGDPRTDDCRRMIALDRRRVVIARLVHGMKMRIGVPTRTYRGVLLSRAEGAADRWTIALVHIDPSLDVCLAESADDESVIADWRSWAKFFGVPALIETDLEDYAVLESGRPAIPSSPKPRRRGRIMNGRRARFLLRRKTGDRRRLATCHAGEREIIARG